MAHTESTRDAVELLLLCLTTSKVQHSPQGRPDMSSSGATGSHEEGMKFYIQSGSRGLQSEQRSSSQDCVWLP